MNFNDIHVGDIAITKEGVRYRIVNFYYTFFIILIETSEKFSWIYSPLILFLQRL